MLLPTNVYRDMSAVSSRLCVMGSGLRMMCSRLRVVGSGLHMMGSGLVSVSCMSHSRTGVMVAGIEVKCATVVATSVGHVDARMTLVEE